MALKPLQRPYIDALLYLFTFLAVAPRLEDPRTGVQKVDRDGVPMWVIDCFVTEIKTQETSVLSVNVASAQSPQLPPMQEIKLHGLKATYWAMASGSGLSFSADSVAPAVTASSVRSGGEAK